ncbi:MAG: GAF domain-containing SpoIIE family protein phosphatase [Rhodothermales bacterium]
MNDPEENTSVERLRRENERLKRAVEELSVLNELAREIGASRDAKEVMGRIVKRSIRALDAEQGVISLVDLEAPDPTRTLVRTSTSSARHAPMRANQQLLGWMFHHRQPILLNDPHDDARFPGTHWDDEVRSILCVPLLARSDLIGILTVFNKKSDAGFTEEDQRLLTIIAAQSAQVVENARLYEEERALLQVRQDLRVAADIQNRLLPQKAPKVPGYDLAGRSDPAENVGGDYYDFLLRVDGSIGVSVADVSGKGLAASLLMATVQASLRARHEDAPDPAACLETLTRLLYRSTKSGSFVSMVYGIVDPRDHLFRYANAGHNRPLLCDGDGSVRVLEKAGIALGALEKARYELDQVRIPEGGVLLLYSDGVSEARNAQREEFGEDRLRDVLATSRGGSASDVLDAITARLAEHVDGVEQHDDTTLLVVKRSA